jgi:hypothetical protein
MLGTWHGTTTRQGLFGEEKKNQIKKIIFLSFVVESFYGNIIYLNTEISKKKKKKKKFKTQHTQFIKIIIQKAIVR